MRMKQILSINRKADPLALGWVFAIAILVCSAFAIANAQSVSSIATQLELGDSGPGVSALQTFLAADAAVYPEGLVTGYYGALTEAAVERYQCKNGIVCQGDAASTGYGRAGPSTLAKIQSQQGTSGGGVSLPPVGFPTLLDISAPILSQPTSAIVGTTASIHWTTNELAHSRVRYATVPPALSQASFDAMASVYDPTFDTSSDVTLSGLLPHTTYHYVIESDDAVGNVQYGIDHSFTTGS